MNFNFCVELSYAIIIAVIIRATCLQSNQTSLEEPNNSTCQRETESGMTGSPTCSLSESKRLITYSLLLVSSLILNFVRGGLFYLVCVNASRVLHNRMFKTILRVPVLFFDTNPSGQFKIFLYDLALRTCDCS